VTEQDKKFMARAIELSEKTSLIDSAGGVFGTVIVQNGEIVGEGANRVVAENDPTWHGEIQAIRNACTIFASISSGSTPASVSAVTSTSSFWSSSSLRKRANACSASATSRAPALTSAPALGPDGSHIARRFAASSSSLLVHAPSTRLRTSSTRSVPTVSRPARQRGSLA